MKKSLFVHLNRNLTDLPALLLPRLTVSHSHTRFYIHRAAPEGHPAPAQPPIQTPPNSHTGRRLFLALVLAAILIAFPHALLAAESTVINSMDTLSFSPTSEKARVQVVDGHDGKALQFSFDADAKSVFAQTRLHPTPEWDTAAGFSFWVKGDGSNHLGGIEVVWNDDYTQRYGYGFSINSTEWKKIVVPWHDLIPEPGAMTKWLDARDRNPPSKLTSLSFGKWWYWKDYAAHSYTIDEMRLEPTVDTPPSYRPIGDSLARVKAKLKAGQPVTIVTMGDSLTDYDHWSNKTTNWPTYLKTAIKEKYGSDVTIINPAMGGTDLRQNLVVMPRWVQENGAPDLVTIFFGANDWAEGMRGPGYYEAQKEAVERVRRATGGKADVLIMTTRPGLAADDAMTEMSDAGRKAAKDENAGLADIAAAYSKIADADRTPYYAWDKVHLGQPGQQLVANTDLQAIAP